MTTRAFSEHFTEQEIEAEHQRALALIREDEDRQRRVRLSFAPLAHPSPLQDVRSTARD